MGIQRKSIWWSYRAKDLSMQSKSIVFAWVSVVFESQKKHAEAIVISVLVVEPFSNGPKSHVAPAAKESVVAAGVVEAPP